MIASENTLSNRRRVFLRSRLGLARIQYALTNCVSPSTDSIAARAFPGWRLLQQEAAEHWILLFVFFSP
jgi:hypothetical protein